jgi:hypothetical protein
MAALGVSFARFLENQPFEFRGNEKARFSSQKNDFALQIGNPSALFCMEQFAQQATDDLAMTPRHFTSSPLIY